MENQKLSRILGIVRAEPAPEVPSAFKRRVMTQVGRMAPPRPLSLSDHLNALFPKVALAALLLMILCLAGDGLLTALSFPGISDGLAQISSQWLLPTSGI